MANLRVNKITGTEVFETTGSVQFDGNGDYLSFSNSSDFAFGTGAFTIEFWVNGPSNNDKFFLGGRGAIGTLHITTGGYDSTLIGALRYVGSSTIVSTSLVTDNSWHHCAIVRDNSNNVKLYVDGVQSASGTDATNYTTTSGTWYFGGNDVSPTSNNLNGHISNLRILKGTALYTKNFTPPTRELTVIPNTVLLCCQSTTRANEERTGKTITVNGNAVANELTPGLLTDRIRSGGSSAISGSVEFNGTGDYLQVSPGNDFTFGTNSFTIEMFVYKGSRTDTHVLYDHRNAGGVQGLHPTLYYSGNNLHYYVNGSNIITTSNYTKNTWQHYALVRSTSTNTIKLYINGIEVASASDTNDYVAPQSGAPYIGQNISGSFYFDGFISNLRVIKGTALYTQNFIPPTRELKNLPGTVLLCCQNSKSATQEATGKTITVNGNATARYFTPPVGFDGFVNFDGATKIKSPNYFYLPTGTTEDRGRGRGLFGGGETPGPNTNVIEYIQIQSQGIAQDFGDLSETKRFAVACSSSTRGVFGGGSTPGVSQKIEFITISTTGNAISFGNLIAPTLRGASCSSSTRGLFAGGYSPATPTRTNAIDYITIASTGSSQDFGDLTIARFGPGALASSTKGIFFGGQTTAPPTSPPGFTNVIDYVTIASTGNALTFGNIASSALREVCGCASATRGVYGSGYSPASPGATAVNVLEYLTISSTGNGTDFGDLTTVKVEVYGSTSNSIRGVWAGGQTPSLVNTIDYVIISSTGNAQDFGDLTGVRCGVGACSDSHGGLG